MAQVRISTGIRLSAPDMDALKRAAKADNRPVASLGELILLDWLRSQEITDAQIKHMVNRFLNWRLPQNFAPDGGISYTRPNYPPSVDATPLGTNLLDANQAEVMVRHMIEGLSIGKRRKN